MNKVIIAGPRDLWVHPTVINSAIQESGFAVDILLHGACPTGVDRCVDFYAERVGIPQVRYHAAWHRYGRAAGPKRNVRMGQDSDNLIIIKREGGWTRGTGHMYATFEGDTYIKETLMEIPVENFEDYIAYLESCVQIGQGG